MLAKLVLCKRRGAGIQYAFGAQTWTGKVCPSPRRNGKAATLDSQKKPTASRSDRDRGLYLSQRH